KVMGPGHDLVNVSTWLFPKLNSSNYLSWAEHMQAALDARELWWGFNIKAVAQELDVDSTYPEFLTYADWKQANDEYKNWVRKDRSTMGLIKGAVEEGQWPNICQATSSKEMWD
ncbi:hypothetical protein P691DRAFT_615942, partial [Macrolepiota fuliginosa MF-IS2]